MAAITRQWWRRLANAYEVKAGMVCLQCNNCVIHTLALQKWASHNGALYKSIFLWHSCFSHFPMALEVSRGLHWLKRIMGPMDVLPHGMNFNTLLLCVRNSKDHSASLFFSWRRRWHFSNFPHKIAVVGGVLVVFINGHAALGDRQFLYALLGLIRVGYYSIF